MVNLFNLILVQPLFNLMVFFYNLIPGHDLVLAIIAITIFIRLILYPLSWKSLKAQKAVKDLQPKLDALKIKYKDNQQQLAVETMALYKQEKVNPFSSCFLLLLQLPFLLAIYQVFRVGLSAHGLEMLYPIFDAAEGVFKHPESLKTMAFAWRGFAGFDLTKGAPLFAILAGVAQFWQTKMMMINKPLPAVAKSEGAKDEDMMAMVNKQMVYTMPLVTVFIGWTLPGGLSFYWLLSTLLTVAQQAWLFRKSGNDINSESGGAGQGVTGGNGAGPIGLEGRVLEGEIVEKEKK